MMLQMKRKLAKQPPWGSYSIWTSAYWEQRFNIVLEDVVSTEQGKSMVA